MKRKFSYKDAEALYALSQGRSIRGTEISKETAQSLLSEGLVSVTMKGRSQTLYPLSASLVKSYFSRLARFTDLDSFMDMARRVHLGYEPTRTEAAQLSNDSKYWGTDVMKGVRISAITPVDVSYLGKTLRVDPPLGTSVEVDDWKSLEISRTTSVVAVENYHTFMRIREYSHLFPREGEYLFTYRDTTSGKKTYKHWTKWLESIPNPFIYFGDLDLGSLKVYVDSFRRTLGERTSFLIPEDYEEIIRDGSSELYGKQSQMPLPDIFLDSAIVPLLETILRYRRCTEQEKLARPLVQ